MPESLLTVRLSATYIDLPGDYTNRILACSTPPGLEGFPEKITSSLESYLDNAEIKRYGLSAINIVNFFAGIVAEMMKVGFPKNLLLGATNLINDYVAILITDIKVRQDTLHLLDAECWQPLRDSSMG